MANNLDFLNSLEDEQSFFFRERTDATKRSVRIGFAFSADFVGPYIKTSRREYRFGYHRS